MIKKEILIKALDDFPDEFSIDELVDKLLFVQKIQTGLAQSDEGKVLAEKEAQFSPTFKPRTPQTIKQNSPSE